LAYAERKLMALGAKPAAETTERLADLILSAQKRAVDAIEKGIPLPAMATPAQPKAGHGPRLSELQKLYTADPGCSSSI
jgi:hypothetical protein